MSEQQSALTRWLASIKKFFNMPTNPSDSGTKSIALNNYWQSAMNIMNNWLKKTWVDFSVLRALARHDALVRICITTIKKSISQSDYVIKKKLRCPENLDLEEQIDDVYNLFDRMNDNEENMRVMLDRIIDDILTLDAWAIEVIWSFDWTKILSLSSIDGATIRPVYNQYWELDEDFAYRQFINWTEVAKFWKKEMVYIMQNPQNDVNYFGYWMSPIESILLQVQASLEADLYNIKAFTKNNIPAWLLDLWPMSNTEAMDFIATWNATVLWNNETMKFVWWSDIAKKYTPFNSSNRDMQFAEYIDWLSRVKLAAFGLTGLDANILQDVNYSTSESQMRISSSKWVMSVKNLIEENITSKIIRRMGENYKWLEFKFRPAVDLKDLKTQAEIDTLNIESWIYNPSFVRERDWIKLPEWDFDEQLQVDLENVINELNNKDKKDEKKPKTEPTK